MNPAGGRPPTIDGDSSSPSSDQVSPLGSPPGRSPRWANLNWIALVLITLVVLVGVFFRFWQLDTIPGINGDEAWLGWKAARAAEGLGLDWKTNSQNLTNPFFILPSIAWHGVAEPSGTSLRLVAAVSGVLLLPVVFFLLRPLFGAPTAWAALWLSALLPLNILYARFGWEPAQSVLFAWPVLGLSLGMARGDGFFWRWAIAAGVAWVAAMLVHPTSFFLAPLLILAALPTVWQWVPPGRARWMVVGAALLALLLVAGGGWWALDRIPFYIRDQILARWQNENWGAEFQLFAVNVARLFTGLEIASTLGASSDWRSTWWGAGGSFWPGLPKIDLLFWLISLGAAGVLLWPRSRKENASARPASTPCVDPDLATSVRRMDRVLILYLVLGSGFFFLLCGAAQLNPGVERYGLWMVPGIVLLWSRAVGLLWPMGPAWRGGLLVAGCALSLSVLGFFYFGYFQHFSQTGGSGALANRTADVEPKQHLARLATQWANETRSPVTLASADWFLMAEASSDSVVRPIFLEPWKRLGTIEEYEAALSEGRAVWRAEFFNHPAVEETRVDWRKRGLQWKEEVLTDAGGRPTLIVFKTQPL